MISNITAGEVTQFKYAIITLCDVERSSNKYKNLLRSNRKSFTFENLKRHIILEILEFILMLFH